MDWNAPILAAFHGLFELMAILSPSWKLDLKITMHRPMNNSEISAKIDIESERAGTNRIIVVVHINPESQAKPHRVKKGLTV